MGNPHTANQTSYKNAMVGVCDILGFKTLLKSISLEEIIEDDFAYLRKALYASIHKKATPEHTPTLEEFQAQNKVGFAWFSDTVLLYSLRDNEEGYRDLIETAAWLIIHTIVKGTIRFRIGVSYGTVFIDPQNRIYLGKPISEAYELQQKQEWSGGALTSKAEARIPQEVKDSGFPYPWHLTQYRVPLKLPKGVARVVGKNNIPREDRRLIRTEQMLAIDWTRFLHKEFQLHWSREREIPLPNEAPSDVILKWYNTREFHMKVCKFCGEQSGTGKKRG